MKPSTAACSYPFSIGPRRPILLSFLVVISCSLRFNVRPCCAEDVVKHLAPGVTLTQEIDQNPQQIINVLTVDLNSPGVRVGVGIGQDRINAHGGREDVSLLARRHGALAAVNGDFFPFTGDPLGMGIRNGELFSEPWTGNGKGGPRSVLGISESTHQVLFDNLGYLGDLQLSDGARIMLDGVNRAVGKNEIVVFTPTYGDNSANKRGGTEVVVQDVNLPLRANKLMLGHVRSVVVNAETPQAIPVGAVVLSGGPGTGGAFLAQHCHSGDKIGFVFGIARPDETRAAVKVASLPRTESDLPSRAGAGISRSAYLWAQVQQAIGGGPRLLSHGQVDVDSFAEGFDPGFADHSHPRTAVGSSADGRRLFVVTVDGRQSISKGVTLAEMAGILKRYGATEGMNLDGGGSTTMAVNGLVVDSPSGSGSERPVADMLLVYSDDPDQPIYTGKEQSDETTKVITIDSEAGQQGDEVVSTLSAPTAHLEIANSVVTAGSATRIIVRDGARSIPGDSSEVIWQGPAGGAGFVNQKGFFIAIKPGSGRISALYHGHLLTAPVTVTTSMSTPEVRETISADLSADPAGTMDRSLLTVRVLDQSGMPHAGAAIHLWVTNGTPDNRDIQTNADGDVTVGITWASAGGGAVSVNSGTLTPVTLRRAQ